MKVSLFSVHAMFEQMSHAEMQEVYHLLHTRYSEPEMYVIGIHTRLGDHLIPIGTGIFGEFTRVVRLFDTYLCVIKDYQTPLYCQSDAWEKVYFITRKEQKEEC